MLVCGGLFACAGFGEFREENPFRLGLWPLYTSDARSWAGVRESSALGPVLHWEENATREIFQTRPLYFSIQTDLERRWHAVYPLLAHRATADREQTWLMLLARSRADLLRDTNQTNIGLGFSGRTEQQKRYGGVFPFAGFFRNRFGFDSIRFLLWPLFARAQRGDYTETQILWPIFKFGSGDGRRLLRVWPLFGLKKREGIYKKYFFLWPFVFRSHERLDSRYPRHSLYILPLYGRSDAGPLASRFYLLPLYLRQWDRREPEIGRLDLLWPVYTRAREADGTELFALRPFYGRKRSQSERTTSLLLGLVARGERHQDAVEEHFWSWLWVNRWATYREGGAERTHLDFWPFYRSLHVREADGREHGFVRLPYLLPMRGLDPDGWDLNYNQLFQLYRARWKDGEERSSLLFGLRELRRATGITWESWGGFLQFRR